MTIILAYDARTGSVIRYRDLEELYRCTRIPKATAKKYLNTPELGDWATKGFYLRYPKDLSTYPWPYQAPHPLQLVCYSKTSKAYICIMGNGYPPQPQVFTEHAKAAKALKTSRAEYDRLILSGWSHLLGATTSSSVSVQFNPRLKSIYQRAVPDNLVQSGTGLFHELVNKRGVKLETGKITHTTTMQGFRFATVYPHITTDTAMMHTARTGIKWWDDNFNLWRKAKYDSIVRLQKTGGGEYLAMTTHGRVIIDGINTNLNHREMGLLLSEAIRKVSDDYMFSDIPFKLPLNSTVPFVDAPRSTPTVHSSNRQVAWQGKRNG